MASEATRVTPGMLPPIISTTPNSPTVWAKLSTVPASSAGLMLGSSTRHKVTRRGLPSVSAASVSDAGRPWKPAWIGCTMNGRLKIVEPTTSPAKLNTSCKSKCSTRNRPKKFCGLKASNR